jgi:peptide/nickel transport system permease protein
MTAVQDTAAGFQSAALTGGRSLRQIIWSRLRRDKVAMVCLIVLVVYYFLGILGPVIFGAMGLNPYTFDASAISDLGGKPNGAWGGISPTHPLGVEWGTGRDIMAQLMFGLRISLVIATSATLITVAIGTVIGIIAGYSGGWTDTIIGRLMDLVLAFPFLLIILALSNVLTDRLTQLGVPDGNPSRIVYLILVLSVFGWPYLARIVRGQVLSLREREFVESAVAMGSSKRRILFTEILPNLWAQLGELLQRGAHLSLHPGHRTRHPGRLVQPSRGRPAGRPRPKGHSLNGRWLASEAIRPRPGAHYARSLRV